MDQYAVVGHPINHSKSPKIHGLFAQSTGELMQYDTIEAPLDGFQQTVSDFFAEAQNKGLNVTVPFKEEAWALCASLSDRARLAGAVNTLFLNDKRELCGDNTDGIGLVRDLVENHQVPLKSKKILILGAGGAVRGILQPILRESPAKVCVSNRTVSKAEALIDLMRSVGNVSACGFDTIDGDFDVIINGTSASLSGDLPPISPTVFASGPVVYDMMYGSDLTVFNAWASELGASRVIDGLGMLVEQAAEAFQIWRKQRPDTSVVLHALRGD